MRRLKAYVHVFDVNGKRHVFTPADEVPEWAAKLITNPKAWADYEPKAEAPKPQPEAPAPVEPKVSLNGPKGSVEVPPRGGPGSGKSVWEKFATANGVAVSDDMNKAEIVAACEAAGVVEAE